MGLSLYYEPGSASTIAHAVLEDAGLSYQLMRLDPRQEDDKPIGAFALYPSERITALAHDDFVIFETGAILLHLLDFPEAVHLIPPRGTRDRISFIRWLFFLEGTLQPTLIDAMHPARWTVDDRDLELVRNKAIKRVFAKFNLLDTHVADDSFLYAGFSALDYYLTSLARWSELTGLSVSFWPRIEKIVSATRRRPAYTAMLRQQGLVWPDDTPPAKKRFGLSLLG
jgi:glutathione S-transferase